MTIIATFVANAGLNFVLDRGMPGLAHSKPLRKMGLHSSPTGELFLEDVRAEKDRLLGETENMPSRDQGISDRRRVTGFARDRNGVRTVCAFTARIRIGREREFDGLRWRRRLAPQYRGIEVEQRRDEFPAILQRGPLDDPGLKLNEVFTEQPWLTAEEAKECRQVLVAAR